MHLRQRNAHHPAHAGQRGARVRVVAATAALVVASAALLAPAPGRAIIGNNLFGKDFCMFACGGDRGVFNFQFFGDASKNLLFDPSIDRLTQKFDGLGDKYAQRFDAILDDKYAKLEMLSRQRIDDLGETLDRVARNNIDLLARTADRRIDRIDTMADAKLDRLDGIANDKLEAFGDLLDDVSRSAAEDLDRTLGQRIQDMDNRISLQQGQFKANIEDGSDRFASRLYLFGYFLLIGLVAVSFHRAWLSNPGLIRKPVALLSLVAVPILLGALGYAVYRHSADTSSPEARWTETRDAALRNQNWMEALSSSQALISTYPDAARHRLAHEKILLLRLFIERPTFLYDPSELEHFLQRVGAYSRDQYALTGQPDHDILAIVALVLAHRGENRVAHYTAAAHATIALEHGDSLPATYRERLVYVLLAYLQDPMSDEEATALLGPRLRIAGAYDIPAPGIARLTEAARRDRSLLSDGDLLFKLHLRGLIVRTSRVFSEANNVLVVAGAEGDRYAAVLDATERIIAEWRALPGSETYARASSRTQALLLNRPYAVENALVRLSRLQKRPRPEVGGDCFTEPSIGQGALLLMQLGEDAFIDAPGIHDDGEDDDRDLLAMAIGADLARLIDAGVLSKRQAGAELLKTLKRERENRDAIQSASELPLLRRYDLGKRDACTLQLAPTRTTVPEPDASGTACADTDPSRCGLRAGFARAAAHVGGEGDPAIEADTLGHVSISTSPPEPRFEFAPIGDLAKNPEFEREAARLVLFTSIRRCTDAGACTRDAEAPVPADTPMLDLRFIRGMPGIEAHLEARRTAAVASIF